ncbi:hypothetical protein VB711_15705 [Cronbergia sp. UHCC 0137]|uniref:hypothetical protein n=1 Tax=Cronbergia sp. UHCC 0137 TaxID=3110239 RepID=UPI002B1ED9E6|nr:hypothetical protein [Cronbergia sp. UHCC 0137]MEA5619273.1 hypothetical protein [Cronbergia sp. UHCC 0137]
MLKRLIQWLKKFFQNLFGSKPRSKPVRENVQQEPAPPLTDTDLEFLFTELLEGVHQARGEAWTQKWFHNIEHRVSTERWLEWLEHFGQKVLASRTPNNDLAARLVKLGELGIGEIGNLAYSIGMQLLTRNPVEPIWEYEGPDAVMEETVVSPLISFAASPGDIGENLPEGEYQTIDLDQFLLMLQQDGNLRQQIAQQLEVETDDPEVIIQTLINQWEASESEN